MIADRVAEELDAEPEKNHPKYGDVDRTLRSKFAEAALRKAVAERVDITDARDDDEAGGKLQLLKALREGTMRTELRFSFMQLDTFSDADLQRVSESLPITLRSLIADFTNCSQLADVAALGAGLEKLQALTSLDLDFGYCKQLPLDPCTPQGGEYGSGGTGIATRAGQP